MAEQNYIFSHLDEDGDALFIEPVMRLPDGKTFLQFTVMRRDGRALAVHVPTESVIHLLAAIRTVLPVQSEEGVGEDDASTIADLKRRMGVMETTLADLLRQDASS